MNGVTVLWSMNAAACLTLAGIHLLVWSRAREKWGHLLFSTCAVAVVGVAVCEWLIIHAADVESMGRSLWWAQVAVWGVFVSLVGFTRSYLRAGQPWLAWAVVGARTVVLGLNFFATPNINFAAITGLRHFTFLGEAVVMPEGVLHPWSPVAKLSNLLLLIFLVNATIQMWRRGERRLAVALGGSMVFFVTVAAGSTGLVERGWVQAPYIINVVFFGFILAMAYELSRDVLRATQLVYELQASETGLRESETRLSLAADAAKLGIWIRDFGRNEIWATANWRRLFGFAPAESLSFDRILQRLHPDDSRRFDQVLTQAMAGGGHYETEYRLVLPSGETHWIVSRGRIEFDGRGKPVLLREVSVDVTARKQAELEVLQQRNELAHLARVNMLGELSGSLAHELNQPLTAILSNAQAAQRFLGQNPVDLAELREILQDIVDQDKRAGEVIHRLRLLLKKGEVQHQPLDVNEVVHEVLKLARSDLVNQGVIVRAELAADLPPVAGDRVQLQQVLINLVMNACDAMAATPAGRRQISVRTASAADGTVTVAVTDQGSGIAPEKLAEIFEPFFTTKPHGLGLGLAVCRTIVSSHGGKLWAANNASPGATFSFNLIPVRVSRP